MSQTPTIGRLVHYKLTAGDVASITAKRLKDGTSGNTPAAGELYPATIVRVWGGHAGVNLQVHLDGPDTHWATSRPEGEAEGQWIWPPRV
ncbi:MAG: hypothetical protein JWQ75_3207 [Pseudarthrobacter sp.]|nr:hypothetical protein [Pseudarthrobacter sp.]